MLAILDEHLLKFHACKDEKSLWEAIKNMFGDNKESKKMQTTILKQNYENFAASSQKGLDKIYDSLEQYCFDYENKSDLDTLSMDDLYNNLKVYESEIKSQSSSSSDSQNVAFVSSDNTSCTNEIVNTVHGVSAASCKDQASNASYANDVMFSFLSNQSNAPQLDNEDLEQIDTDDLKEIDLEWQVVMLTMRVKRFIKKTGRKLDLNGKDIVGFDKTKVECYNCHRRCHFSRECRASRNQGNKNRDAPTRNAPVDTSTTNALLENALKEKDDLKLKLEKFETSSKNLTKLINSQISAVDKTGLGYDGQMNESDVNKSEVLNNLVDSYESDGDDNQVNDRFKKVEGYHAVPPPYTRNYMPPRADLSFVGLDNSIFKSKEPNSKDENVFEPKEVKKTVKPSLEKIEFFNARNTTIKNKNKVEKLRKFSQSPRAAVLTKSGQVPVNAAKQSFHRVTVSVSTARRVNTATSRPNVNNALPTTYSYFKAHSPVRRPFNKKSAAKINNFNEKVNTAKVNNVTTAGPKAVVSATAGNRNNVVKSSACWIWRPKGNLIDH
nr:hypothetical protein [Tanacetum cinerariifolium]